MKSEGWTKLHGEYDGRRGGDRAWFLHGVLKSVSWQIRRVLPLSWFQGWRKKKMGTAQKQKALRRVLEY